MLFIASVFGFPQICADEGTGLFLKLFFVLDFVLVLGVAFLGEEELLFRFGFKPVGNQFLGLIVKPCHRIPIFVMATKIRVRIFHFD